MCLPLEEGEKIVLVARKPTVKQNSHVVSPTAILFRLLVVFLLFFDRSIVVHKHICAVIFRIDIALRSLVARTEIALLRP